MAKKEASERDSNLEDSGAPSIRKVAVRLCDELRLAREDTASDCALLYRRFNAHIEDVSRTSRNKLLDEDELVRASADDTEKRQSALNEIRKLREERRDSERTELSKINDEYREAREALLEQEDERIRAAWRQFARDLSRSLASVAEQEGETQLRAMREDLCWVMSVLQ